MKLRSLFFSICFAFIINNIFTKDAISFGKKIDDDIYIDNSNCMTNEEHNTLKIRIMQDQINIASRNCKNINKNLFLEINKKFKKKFISNDIALEVFFQKFANDNPNKEMNNFITENANSASLKVIYDKKTFCDEQKNIVEQLLKSDIKLSEFAKKHIKQRITNPKLCSEN